MNSSDIFKQRLRLAVAEATDIVQDEAKQTHNFKTKSGKLEDSVKQRTEADGLTGVVYLDTQEAPYARAVYFGSQPHTIIPRNRFALRWPTGDAFVFARIVHHPGTRPDPFLQRALEAKKSDIDAIFIKHTESALQEVADAIRGSEYTWRG